MRIARHEQQRAILSLSLSLLGVVFVLLTTRRSRPMLSAPSAPDNNNGLLIRTFFGVPIAAAFTLPQQLPSQSQFQQQHANLYSSRRLFRETIAIATSTGTSTTQLGATRTRRGFGFASSSFNSTTEGHAHAHGPSSDEDNDNINSLSKVSRRRTLPRASTPTTTTKTTTASVSATTTTTKRKRQKQSSTALASSSSSSSMEGNEQLNPSSSITSSSTPSTPTSRKRKSPQPADKVLLQQVSTDLADSGSSSNDISSSNNNNNKGQVLTDSARYSSDTDENDKIQDRTRRKSTSARTAAAVAQSSSTMPSSSPPSNVDTITATFVDRKTKKLQKKKAAAKADAMSRLLLNSHELLSSEQEQSLGRDIQQAQQFLQKLELFLEEKKELQQRAAAAPATAAPSPRQRYASDFDNEDDDDCIDSDGSDDDDDDDDHDDYLWFQNPYAPQPQSLPQRTATRRHAYDPAAAMMRRSQLEEEANYYAGVNGGQEEEDSWDGFTIFSSSTSTTTSNKKRRPTHKRLDLFYRPGYVRLEEHERKSLLSAAYVTNPNDNDDDDNVLDTRGSSTESNSAQAQYFQSHNREWQEWQSLVSDQDLVEQFNITGGWTAVHEMIRKGAMAREELIRNNLRLVVKIAKTWCLQQARSGKDRPTNSPGVNQKSFGTASSPTGSLKAIYEGSWDRPSLDEVIQEGILGLARAAERYNPERQIRFSTYAYPWITNMVRLCFYTASTGVVRIPAHYHEMKSRYKRNLREYYQEQNAAGIPNPERPSLEYMATRMNVQPHILKKVLRSTSAVMSLDAPHAGLRKSGKSIIGRSGSMGSPDGASDPLWVDSLIATSDASSEIQQLTPEEMIDLSFLRQALEHAMATCLAPYERDIIRLRLGLDDGVSRTFHQVATAMAMPLSSSGGGVAARRRQGRPSGGGGNQQGQQEQHDEFLLSVKEIRLAERRALEKLRSPYALATYRFMSYLDFAGVDRNTMTSL